MQKLGRAALVVAIIGWLVLAAFAFGYYGGDLASAILGVLGLLIGVAAAYCLGRAIDERGERVGLLWAGRALALFGAAFVIVFPAILYGEIVQLIQRGKPLTYDIEAAIWHEFRVMPLTLVPALVALRWARIGGLLFLLLAAYSIADGLSLRRRELLPRGGERLDGQPHRERAGVPHGRAPPRRERGLAW